MFTIIKNYKNLLFSLLTNSLMEIPITLKNEENPNDLKEEDFAGDEMEDLKTLRKVLKDGKISTYEADIIVKNIDNIEGEAKEGLKEIKDKMLENGFPAMDEMAYNSFSTLLEIKLPEWGKYEGHGSYTGLEKILDENLSFLSKNDHRYDSRMHLGDNNFKGIIIKNDTLEIKYDGYGTDDTLKVKFDPSTGKIDNTQEIKWEEVEGEEKNVGEEAKIDSNILNDNIDELSEKKFKEVQKKLKEAEAKLKAEEKARIDAEKLAEEKQKKLEETENKLKEAEQKIKETEAKNSEDYKQLKILNLEQATQLKKHLEENYPNLENQIVSLSLIIKEKQENPEKTTNTNEYISAYETEEEELAEIIDKSTYKENIKEENEESILDEAGDYISEKYEQTKAWISELFENDTELNKFTGVNGEEIEVVYDEKNNTIGIDTSWSDSIKDYDLGEIPSDIDSIEEAREYVKNKIEELKKNYDQKVFEKEAESVLEDYPSNKFAVTELYGEEMNMRFIMENGVKYAQIDTPWGDGVSDYDTRIEYTGQDLEKITYELIGKYVNLIEENKTV